MTWEEYSKVGPATDDDIRVAEEKLGVIFPGDLSALLKAHQGMVPSPRHLRLFDERRKTKFGPLMHVSQTRGGGDYIPAAAANLRLGGYPPELVPFAGSGGQVHFALDYRENSANPTVVYVVLEFGYDKPDVFRQVAPNVTALLNCLEPE